MRRQRELRTEDFIWKDGTWQPQRTYVWRRVSSPSASAMRGFGFTDDPKAAPLVFDDVQYFMGYKITESYYCRAKDKKRAIVEIHSVTDYPTFLEQSGYATSFRDQASVLET